MNEYLRDVYVVDAVRTPIGRYGGALSSVRPDDLAAGVLRGLLDRSPTLDPGLIGDVLFGNSNGAGEENRDVARMAVLLAGLPVTVPGATVNRLCGSGMEAVIQAARAVALGDVSIAVAGGVESMSRAPWVLPKPERAFPAGNQQLYSTTLGWRMINPRMPEEWTIPLGESAELIADKYGITREAQDVFALASHRKASQAWKDGAYDAEVVPVDGVDLPATRESVTTRRSMRWPVSSPSSVRAVRSQPAAPRPSTTARQPCCWPTRPGWPRSAVSRWPGSGPAP